MDSYLIIVTGSSGFIGSHLVKKLLNTKNFNTLSNIYVLGIDIRDPIIIDNSNYMTIQTDLSIYDDKICDEIIKIKNEYMITNIIMCHLAARISVEESMKDPILYYRHNVTTTLIVLELMKKIKCHYLVFSSTAAVYNKDNIGNIDPTSIYGHTKYMSEELITMYHNLYGFKSIIFS